MKIVIQEVTFHREGCITTNTTLDSDFKYSWERGLVEHEIDSLILNVLKEQGVYGWIEGKNMLGCCVFRTYMLIPESVADVDNWNK